MQDRLEQVQAVLDEYQDYLPLTLRQIFYRLVGMYGYPKTEKDYGNLGETLNRARRAGIIPMDAIRDDGFHFNRFQGWQDGDKWIDATSEELEQFKLDRQQGQARRLVVWCEAGGMVSQLRRIASEYSVPVASSGGFDSTTVKHNVGRWLALIGPATVLHIGDHDPSGVHLFGSLDEDVGAFVDHYGGDAEFIRLAVTPEQIDLYGLPTAPPKATDNRSFQGMTTQAEALDPATLANILKFAIESRLDIDEYTAMLALEKDTKADLRARFSKAF